MTYERPQKLDATVIKMAMPCGALWITIGIDNKGFPREVFNFGSKNGTCRSNLEAGARLATKLLQKGLWDDVIDALQEIRCDACMRTKGKLIGAGEDKEKWMDYPSSCGDAVGRELKKLLEERKK